MLYPVMTSSRLLSDLSGIWAFRADNGHGFEEKWYEKPLVHAMSMAVPSSYNDLKESRELRDHTGWVFYQRTFSIPAWLHRTQRVVLRCDAVTMDAIVYLNGKKIGSHKGGFLPFEFEIGEYLEDGENLLTIAVSNIIDYTSLPVGGTAGLFDAGSGSQKKNSPNFDFFNYSGITRPVRIYTTPKTYIRDIALNAEVQDDHASVSYAVEASGQGKCLVELFDAAGKKVAESRDGTGKLAVDHVHLWQPGSAYLYQVKVTLTADNGEADVYTMPYGIRTVAVKGSRFLINGRPFYFKGYGKHEDTFPNGRGLNLPMNVKDIAIMKWQGANSFRTSHYPYSEEMMRLCDEEGIVVIDETPAVGVNLLFGGGANFHGKKVGTFDPEGGIQTFAHHQDVIRDLIARDKNHACVVMWSLANEPDSYSEGAYEYFKPLYDLARQLDPQKRPCTIASVQMAGGPDKDISARLSDVICLNRYYGWYYGGPDLEASEKMLRKELMEWAKTGKPVMITEYGADAVMGVHETTAAMYTEEYQVEYYEMNNRVLDEFSCVTGEQAWNFADFQTGQSIMRVDGNRKGLFTRDRKPKLAAHYFRHRWHEIPDFDYKK